MPYYTKVVIWKQSENRAKFSNVTKQIFHRGNAAIVFWLEENAATLFARFLRGVVRQGCWMCFLAPLEMGVLSTLVQPEWTDYAHQEQTNKHYYEHPRIRKHNDTSITKAVQCYAIGFYRSRPRFLLGLLLNAILI